MDIDYLITMISCAVGIEHELDDDVPYELFEEAEELSALANRVIYLLEDEM
ncbi:hypothetical protein L2747_18840 [Shewanella marinintestina]|uniref:hypothetical protein n=1 Tax=Shewanella marinintestina TaxID=190305 RepID=UPI00200D458B|nr:hypothetical protein [Shewanella marinintestina]MCL1148064.1 hypothetical protein [Shewanella marinintestina]